VTEHARHTDPGNRPDAAQPRRSGPGDAGREADEAAKERVVIRDKRKIKVSDGRYTANTADQTSTEEVPAPAETGNEEEPVAQAQPDGVAVAAQPDDARPDVVVIEPTGGEAPVVDLDSVPTALGAELEALRAGLDERTSDLQRLSAEFANYRKRVERDRALVVEQATGNVLAALLPVLDDLDRARDHGDLIGPFGAVAEQLTATLSKFGLTPFGAKGDPFDPTRHEAVAHSTSGEVSEPTCVDVMRRGYLLGERLLRPALVAVADPE